MRDPFDLVREWFVAYNRGDLAALGSYYGEDASLDHDAGRVEGRAGIDAAWLARFTAWGPGFQGGVRRRIRMVGRVETGLIRAEWLEREADGAGTVRERRGYSDFRVERGHILSHHDGLYAGTGEPENHRRRAAAAATQVPATARRGCRRGDRPRRPRRLDQTQV